MVGNITIDAGSWLTANGIQTTVFFGTADAVVEIEESYETLIDKELDAHTLLGGIITPRTAVDAQRFVQALEDAAEYANRKLNEMINNSHQLELDL
jgi:citrate lyase alpha subunit